MNILKCLERIILENPVCIEGGPLFSTAGSFSYMLYTKIFLCRLLYHNATERQARMECGRFVAKNFRYMF